MWGEGEGINHPRLQLHKIDEQFPQMKRLTIVLNMSRM